MRKAAQVVFNIVSLIALFVLVFLSSILRFTKEKGNLSEQRTGSTYGHVELNYAYADAAPEGVVTTPECTTPESGSCECAGSSEGSGSESC